jgi:hypothetical protein
MAVARSSWFARSLLGASLLGAMVSGLGSCSYVVRYTDELVDARYGRTWFTRLPSTVGGTMGFVAGVPVDVVALPFSWVYYRTQPKETRDPLSAFLFPSFVLWKACALLGMPFDVIEWAAWRSWEPPRPITLEERDAIERSWDEAGWSEYPVTPIYPPPPVQSSPR